MRNHEVNNPGAAFGPVGDHTYDPMARGGCTVIEVTREGEVLSAYTGLNGTMMNCSGGQMPWGAWITCEETVNGPDVGPDFTGASNVPLTKPHGYVFEVPTTGLASGEPITRAGRFAHEAVAFDPEDGYLYLTEDNFAFPSGYYRYKPKRHPMKGGHIDNEGTLQMLAVKGTPNAHLEAQQEKGATYDVRVGRHRRPGPRVPVHPGPDRADEQRPGARLRRRPGPGPGRGALLAARGAGLRQRRRLLHLHPGRRAGDDRTRQPGGLRQGLRPGLGLPLPVGEAAAGLPVAGQETLDFPDNITVSERGTLVVCEDSSGDNYVRGLTRGGQLWDIALNRLTSSTGAPRYGDEFAGSTFSPDGHTLFVNIQASAGMTFAIWGPWHTDRRLTVARGTARHRRAPSLRDRVPATRVTAATMPARSASSTSSVG